MNIFEKLNQSKLYSFTPDKFSDRNILDIVEEQVSGEVDIVQLREKKLNLWLFMLKILKLSFLG